MGEFMNPLATCYPNWLLYICVHMHRWISTIREASLQWKILTVYADAISWVLSPKQDIYTPPPTFRYQYRNRRKKVKTGNEEGGCEMLSSGQVKPILSWHNSICAACNDLNTTLDFSTFNHGSISPLGSSPAYWTMKYCWALIGDEITVQLSTHCLQWIIANPQSHRWSWFNSGGL